MTSIPSSSQLKTSSSPDGPDTVSATPATAEPPVRPTRKQVSRACDWARGADCTHKGTDEPRTLPQAMREIEKLKLKVKEQQAEIAGLKLKEQQAMIPTPTETSTTSASPTASSRHNSHNSQQQGTPSFTLKPKPQWEGIWLATSRSDQTSYYGPSSHFYFVSRIGTYLNKALQQPCAAGCMQPQEARKNIAMTNPAEAEEAPAEEGEPHSPGTDGRKNPSMSRMQEEYFLSLFWESYHCFAPVVDEADFRRHYASLWEPRRPYRKMSPLVDIVLAVCLQFGYSFMPKATTGSSSSDDATMAGRWYYRRCQSLLTADLESPTLNTVQCLIFSIAYLCCASFHNMAHLAETQAIRTAQIIGLHHDPAADMSRPEKELRRRVWWILWMMEAKTAAKLGRPVGMDRSEVSTLMPSDDIEAASANGALLGSFGNVTWLSYNLQLTKLIDVSFSVHTALYDRCGEAIASSPAGSLYKDPQALESCAELLATRIPVITAWADAVPSSLKMCRRYSGEAFSVDRTPLNIDFTAPMWLQRQRICLELMYHTQILNLSRPFITFYSNSTTYTPIAERHAAACVSHAIAHTLVMHQVVTETDLMGGWSEFFFWQWNAAITISGFILAYPIHPSTPNARLALEKGVAIFDIFGANFAVAADAAKIIRDLMGKADLLTGRLRYGITSGAPQEMPPNASSSSMTTTGAAAPVPGPNGLDVTGGTAIDPAMDDGLGWLDPSEQSDPNYFSEFMDWALSVDQFNSFERFFDASNPADPFLFGQQMPPPPPQQ
ncbi:putative transcriptional regulatory protein-like protein [Emericellopsis cladophorae]|uniref:Transcriptional regulatory protein-like protein n=1 Tax=Emericellopsis cladophorae TaxID=2686198 RepID=A0A9Q0BI55_9HYPO|nr:putative transcriptional regulatory protein-like protein [Emericellopsis cladophorae]KAI6785465.1 putative transcriptional regulatory protein-like protein [Emericellopsis cladophorae]